MIPQPPAPALPPLTLTGEQVASWWGRITLARATRKHHSGAWASLLKSYLPPPESGTSYDVSSNVHFRDTHLKIAEMWAQMPEWHLTPLEPLFGLTDPQTGQPFAKSDGQPMDPAEIAAHVVAVKREVLNTYLGPDQADLDHAVIESLFKIFTTSGVGPIAVHYQCDLQDTPIQVPGPETTMPGAVLGLQGVPGPSVEQMVPVPVFERICTDAFSAEKLLIPHDWRSTKYHRAPWLGEEFVMPWPEAQRLYGLDDTFRANVSRDDMVIALDAKSADGGSTDLFHGVRIWLRASRFDPNVAHSELFYFLVLAEGISDKPAKYVRSPYQTVGPDGRLTPDSMLGNPINIITLRPLPDHAWPPADAAFTDPLVRIENTWLSQDVKARDANIPRFGASDAIKDAVEKLAEVDVGQGVLIPDEFMQRGMDKLIVPIPHLEHAQSDVIGRAEIRRAREETLGLGSNQAGSVTSKVHSATENAIVQQNVSTRMKGERTQLMKPVLAIVRQVDALIQRYATKESYVEIVGPSGERTLAMWNQQLLAGRYAYKATPDSQLAKDPDKRRKDVLDYVNFLAKSPYTNQAEMHRVVDLEFGFDPQRMMKTPDPPPEPKPSMSYAFKGDDMLNPLCVAVMLKGHGEITAQDVTQAQQLILSAAGAMVSQPVPGQAEALMAQQAKKQAAQQPHGGTADKSEPLSKKESDMTGQLPGPKPGGALPQAPTSGMVQ